MGEGNKTSSNPPSPSSSSPSSSSYFACYSSTFACGGVLADSTYPDTNDFIVPTLNTNFSAKLQEAAKGNANATQSSSKKSNNNNMSNMKRSSVSRRAEHLSSPRPRSRSQEGLRTLADEEELRFLDQLAAEAAEADQEQSPNGDLHIDSEHVDTSSRAFQDNAKNSAGSTRSAGSSGGFHRRAMSDPFDAQEIDKESALIRAEKEDEKGLQILATLPRYPVQAQRNKNCWSEPPVSIFHVRGPAYLSNKKKVPSGPYLLPARGADLFLAETPVDYAQPSKSEIVLGGQLRKFPTVVINFKFPWGNMLLYYEVPVKLAKYLTGTSVKLDPSLTSAQLTLAKWLMGDDTYRNDRLKLIPYVAEGPWIVRSMVTGKPALIGKKLPVTYQLTPADAATGQAAVLEATLDIGGGSATAKRIVSVCRRYMSALTADIGFVIQAETAEELPEQMLGSIRIHGIDPLQAPKLS